MSRSRRSALTALSVLALALPVLVAPTASAASTAVVISEAYGGGGNSGAALKQDFIELRNDGAPVDLTGWSVQYHSGSATGGWQVTALSGTLAAGAYLLIGESFGVGGSADLPAHAINGTIAMSATSGTVALVNDTTALTCLSGADCASHVVDLVGFGSAAINETAPAPGASNTASVTRGAAPDSDNNAEDFSARPPTPAVADAVPTDPCDPLPSPGTTRIHDIQGHSFVSPLDGQTVTGVAGIVTGVRTTGSKGYFLQDPTADTDPGTSEGIFVFTAPTVAVGDAVLVSGQVQDFYPDGAPAVATALSITEISKATTCVVSHANALPAPEVISPTTVPERYAPDLGGAGIETTPITPARSALDFWESREGMRVQVDNARVVGPTDSFGEQYVTTKPEQKASFRGGTLLTAENDTPSGRLEIVPLIANPTVQVGDRYTGATVGPVDYSRFGGYLIAATQLGTVTSGGISPTVVTPASTRQLSIATYNVENLAPGDAATKYAALARGIVTNLGRPDIVAVEEVQDNSGATDDGVVAADVTLTKLTAAVVAAGGPQYSWRLIDPADDQDGGQPGGNIRNVFLFDPSRVSFVDRGAASVNRTTTGTAVTGSLINPSLTLSPGRIDPTNPAWTASRKPLVGEFRYRGLPVFVIANHFNSKGGDQNADGRYQYPDRTSEVQRQQQATLVHNFVRTLLKKNPLAQTVVLGDLNDYQFSPALQVLKTGRADGRATPLLVDLITTLPRNQQYTYVYQGISQVLDHILVTPGVYLTGSVDYQVVHINSEFANQTSDHDPQVVRLFGRR